MGSGALIPSTAETGSESKKSSKLRAFTPLEFLRPLRNLVLCIILNLPSIIHEETTCVRASTRTTPHSPLSVTDGSTRTLKLPLKATHPEKCSFCVLKHKSTIKKIARFNTRCMCVSNINNMILD